MAYPRLYRRKHGVWYVEVARDKVISLGTRDHSEARKAYNKIKRRIAQGKLASILGECSVTLGQYAESFLQWSESSQPRSTFRANRLALAKLRAVAGDSTKLDRVSIRHLDAMVSQELAKGLRQASVNNYVRHARASFNKAVEWGHLKRNPLAGAKELRTERRQPSFIVSTQEIARFIGSIEDPELRCLVLAFIATGRRRAELLNLEWPDVDLPAGRYLVRRSKTHLSKWYPINSTFRAVLEAMGGSGRGRVFARWSHPDTVSKVVKRALEAFGLGHLRLHDLRHTYAAHQVMQGRPLRAVQELLGHTEARTTEIYAHLADDYLTEMAEIRLGPIDLLMRAKREQAGKKTSNYRPPQADYESAALPLSYAG